MIEFNVMYWNNFVLGTFYVLPAQFFFQRSYNILKDQNIIRSDVGYKLVEKNVIHFITNLERCIWWIQVHPVLHSCQNCKRSNSYVHFTLNILANHNKLNAFTVTLATTARLFHGETKLLYMTNWSQTKMKSLKRCALQIWGLWWII